jgi:hypothetical protein
MVVCNLVFVDVIAGLEDAAVFGDAIAVEVHAHVGFGDGQLLLALVALVQRRWNTAAVVLVAVVALGVAF